MPKHRRKSIARKKFKNVAVVGATTTTLALSGASPATAQPSTAWDEIINCESSNRNVENPSPSSSASGYFQIIDSTWVGAGGQEFAPRAIDATFEEQAIVAQRIAEGRGSLADWNASKHCWGDNITSELPDGPAGSVPVEAPPAPVVEPPVEAPVEPAPVVPASTYTVVEGDYLVKIGESLGLNWQEIANLNGIGGPYTIVPGQVLQLPVVQQSVTVEPGDTLSTIATVELGMPSWEPLYEANKDVIGPDPDLIYPGQVFFVGGLPVANAPATVVEAAEETVAPVPAPQVDAAPPFGLAPIQNSAGPVTPRSQEAADRVFSNVTGASLITIGGTRHSAKDMNGHPAGNALDYMVLSDASLGDAIVEYHKAHWNELGVEYLIWQQRILYSPNGSWENMGDRGGTTANHYDHVHVNYRG